jgi:hypothetical protein
MLLYVHVPPPGHKMSTREGQTNAIWARRQAGKTYGSVIWLGLKRA